MTLLYIFLAALLILLVSTALYNLYVALMVSRGIYPKKGSASMSDVARLIEQGKYSLARRCYRRLTNTSLKGTASAIEKMRKEKFGEK